MEIVIRIDDVNPIHATLSVFTSGMRFGHPTSSRGLSGSLCIDAEVLPEFILQTQPDGVRWNTDKLGAVPEWLTSQRQFQDELWVKRNTE